ncbi:MAG: formate dehydrogenase accessory sulfurtransferase FdhD [Trueperaceae bacterium]|nr:MAG: formate dehydrogenase accessory sulfurtransferase FdhD [Trueperaceae bacterium]
MSVVKVQSGASRVSRDHLTTEEPLELRLRAELDERSVAVTMRTPGADFELAAGFLYAEGVVNSREEIRRISYCLGVGDEERWGEQRYNTVTVELEREALPELGRLERSVYANSACGVCGRVSLEALELRGLRPLEQGVRIGSEILTELPGKLRDAQGLFDQTGGLHAAALFTADGELLALREDVGRHNALDKLLGWALFEGRLPLSEAVVVLSGRASFELVQKSLAAGVSVVCALSAPSSLAVSLARRFEMTLVGFLRGMTFNIYAGEERIVLAKEVVT